MVVQYDKHTNIVMYETRYTRTSVVGNLVSPVVNIVRHDISVCP